MPSTGPRSFRTSRAFLIRAADMGEADRRLTFFTESEGVATLVAKAARRSRKRFGGALQRYLLLDVGWSEVPGRMALLTSASVLAGFWDIVSDWEKVRHADYILELSAVLFPQPGPKPKAFEALSGLLRTLALGDEDPAAVRCKAEAAFLSLAGWGPDLLGCKTCGKTENPSFRFLNAEGSLLCRACGEGKGTPLSLGAVKTWRALQGCQPHALGRVRIPESILKELQFVIPKYIEWSFGVAFRSLGGQTESRKP